MEQSVIELQPVLGGVSMDQPKLICPVTHVDGRGWLRNKYGKFDMDSLIGSFNEHDRTWRGFHYQIEPYAQAKVITCVRGAISDFVIDLRPGGFTHLAVYKAILTQENGFMLYVPKGFAHGYLTTEPKTEVVYLIEGARVESAERGIRWDDPMFDLNIHEPNLMSVRDKDWPDYKP